MNLAKSIVFLVVCFCCLNQAIQAQTTAFTYQGKLTDGGMSPTAQYDFLFTIFGADVGGAPVSGDIIVENVQVTNGIFTVNLDFGTVPFDSPTDNHLEISVRPGASVGAFTTLAPRQRITSSPYAIKSLKANTADSLSAACVLCVTDAQISSIGAGKITGVLSYFQGGTGFGGTFLPAGVFLRSNGAGWQASGISPSDIPSGSTNYIQNIPGIGTQSASFNINGGGTANIFSATTQYNIGGNRVLSVAGISNIFAGINAGAVNTGANNSFFGWSAGQANTSANNNSFFGTRAGLVNDVGDSNSFFGSGAGQDNTNGSTNSFFGNLAGENNTSGTSNSFFGSLAGQSNAGGGFNSFFGVRAGDSNTGGTANTIIGSSADVGSGSLTNATAIGSGAIVSQSNSLVLGSGANVGIGTSTPNAKLQVAGGNIYIANPGGNLIMTSPNGACWAISVSNAGVLTTASVACP